MRVSIILDSQMLKIYGANAFKMIAVEINKLTSKGLSAEKWKSLRELD